MDTEKVVYEMSLKDMLSAGLENADSKANKLEATIGRVAGAVGALFAAAEIFSFIKESVGAFNESAQASAQLDASLQSTNYEAGVTREALDKLSLSVMDNSLFDDDAVTNSEALLTTFTNIKGAIYTDAIPAIADMATKMGTDLNGATIQVGKALNDPIKGIAALSRVGVSFTEKQKDMIKHLVETGHQADAQRMILAELTKEFGGSAAAAAAAGTGPFTVLGHQFGNIKERIGEIVVNIASRLLPIFEHMITLFDSAITFVQTHKTELEALAITVGVFATALFLLEIPMIATTIASWALTAGFAAISFVLSISPLGWFIGLLALATGAIFLLWKKSETFRSSLYGIWEVMKGLFKFVMDAGGGVANILSGVFTADFEQVKKGTEQIKDAWKNLDIGGDFEKGKQKGLAAFAAEQAEDKKSALVAGKKGKPGVPGMDAVADKKDKVVGNKSVSIVVNVDNLVREFNVTTNNFKDSATKAGEVVANALLGAVNDFQLTAGQ